MFEISGRGNHKTLLFDRHHSSPRSQAKASERGVKTSGVRGEVSKWTPGHSSSLRFANCEIEYTVQPMQSWLSFRLAFRFRFSFTLSKSNNPCRVLLSKESELLKFLKESG